MSEVTQHSSTSSKKFGRDDGNTVIKLLVSIVALVAITYGGYRVARHYSHHKLAVNAYREFDFNTEAKYKPQYGKVRLGAYSGEAADLAGLPGSSILNLCKPEAYKQYREMIRYTYGLDLEDMNYFGVGPNLWEGRIERLRTWLLMAGNFGDITLSLEPTGYIHYDVFQDTKGMRHLKRIFEELGKKKVTIWIRFASEANLSGSTYSAANSDKRAIEFYTKAQWFRSYMPKNAKLVFSPLINTAVLDSPRQVKAIRWMFQGGDTQQGKLPWERIGGTIYRTDMALIPAYNKYYKTMTDFNSDLPFQICELGGPFKRLDEIKDFLKRLSEGQWPRVVKVNLFARDINKRADPSGSFGFVDPAIRSKAIKEAQAKQKPVLVESWLKEVIAPKKS